MAKGIDEFETRLMASVDLIAVFISELDCRDAAFYRSINKACAGYNLTRDVQVDGSGLLNKDNLLKQFRDGKHDMFIEALFTRKFSMAAKMIYDAAVVSLGERRADKSISSAIKEVRRRHGWSPDLAGWIGAPKPMIEAGYPFIVRKGILSSLAEAMSPLAIKDVAQVLGIRGSFSQKDLSRLSADPVSFVRAFLTMEAAHKAADPQSPIVDRGSYKDHFNLSWLTPLGRSIFIWDRDDVTLLFIFASDLVRRLWLDSDASHRASLRDELGSLARLSIEHGELKGIDLHVIDNPSVNEVEPAIKKILSLAHAGFSRHAGEGRASKVEHACLAAMKDSWSHLPAFTAMIRLIPDGMLEDVKIKVLTDEELRKVSARLEHLDVMKSDFMNMAAHELRTPLTPIGGMLGAMLAHPKRFGLNREGRKNIEMCLSNVDRLKRLVMDILDISKLEAHEMKFKMRRFDILPVIRESISGFEAQGLRTSLDAASIPPIFADPDRLRQVLDNLVGNAHKFARRVSVKVSKVGNHVRVDVKDDGIGLSKEDIPKLFVKFSQIPKEDSVKGTGLGLAICKEIISAHDGRIWAESKGHKKGSTFSFTLPIR